MSDTVLVAETGRPTGSAAARRLRAEDKIPAVVYGRGMEPIALLVNRRDLRLALSGPAGLNTVLDLTVGDATYSAIVKEMQRHPVRRTVSHVDFLQIDLTKEITVSVPMRLEGDSAAVAAVNGLIDPAVDSIEVVTTPRSIPDEIVIDISAMTPDTVIRLGDITLPAGVTATGDPDMPLVTVMVTRGAAPTAEEAAAQASEDAAGDASADTAGDTAGDAADNAAGDSA